MGPSLIFPKKVSAPAEGFDPGFEHMRAARDPDIAGVNRTVLTFIALEDDRLIYDFLSVEVNGAKMAGSHRVTLLPADADGVNSVHRNVVLRLDLETKLLAHRLGVVARGDGADLGQRDGELGHILRRLQVFFSEDRGEGQDISDVIETVA